MRWVWLLLLVAGCASQPPIRWMSYDEALVEVINRYMVCRLEGDYPSWTSGIQTVGKLQCYVK